MKEKTGQIFSITKDNPTVAGCTVSKSIYCENGYDFTYFSLAECTDISAETYEYPKICIVNSGKMEVYTSDNEIWKLSTDEIIVLPMGKPVGMRTETGCIYTEIAIRKESNMNKVLETGKVLKLADLLPYQEGRIVNMDLINREKLLLEIEKAKAENRTFDYDSLIDFIKVLPKGTDMIDRIIERIQSEIKQSDNLEKIAYNAGLLRALAIIKAECDDMK